MVEVLIPREGGVMPAPRKYPQELRERAVRLVLEAREQEVFRWRRPSRWTTAPRPT